MSELADLSECARACDGLNLYDDNLQTPAYVIDLARLRRNNRILDYVARKSGAQILLALKAYSCYKTFPLLRGALAGTCASSLDEARLSSEEFSKETHVFSPAYKEEQIEEYLKYCSHFSFNSISQWLRFRERLCCVPGVSCGLRINPEHRETDVEMYDPCGKFSRLGITVSELEKGGDDVWRGVEGLHFHNLCEKYAEHFARTLCVVEKKFGKYLHRMKWINCGGGHLVTSPGYDVEKLISLLRSFREKYGVEVYLEPGEAHARDAGVLVSEVVDVLYNQMPVAIMDTSAATHMPDVLEMPYRPEITGAGESGAYANTYRLGGPSCLAGDVIGDYSFAAELAPGGRLAFEDMAHYTMVKTNTFNGIRLPSIYTYDPDNRELVLLHEYSYRDFKSRLA